MHFITKIIATIPFVLLKSENSLVYAGYGRHGYGNFCGSGIVLLLGILALIGLVAALILGFHKSGNRKKILFWHKKIAIITMFLITLHVISTLILH